MKRIVNCYLNVRVGRPSVNAPSYQYLAPGSELQVDGQFYKGDKIEGNNTWLRDDANNYYWSGGLEKIHEPETPLALEEYVEDDCWWHKDFSIGKLWSEGLTGEGIKMAVLDSGIALPHPDLILSELNQTDLSNSSSGIKDWTGHGTHVSGIIKASSNGFGVKGLAFNSNFYIAKITNDIHGDKIEYLIRAIEWAVLKKVDIISISNGLEENNPLLEAAIKNTFANRILVICAAGNRVESSGNDILYPARYPQTLSVGGVTKGKLMLADTLNTMHTDIFAPGENILSTFLNKSYEKLSGSSQAAPYVAGVAALLLEEARKNNPHYSPLNLKKELLEGADTTSFGKLINPVNTLKRLIK
jgi:subtilisin family serine protease